MFRKPLSFLLLLIAAAFLTFLTPSAAQVPYGFWFVSTREAASNVLYDSFHQRFYLTVPGENSVYLVNEVDGSVLQKISIPSAFGLDLSVDGTRLFVTSSVTVLGAGAAQGYFVIDASTLHVVDFVQPTIIIPPVGFVPNYSVDNTPRFVAALSNGKVAYSAEETGVTGGSIFLNDPATNLTTNIVYSGYYDGAISKALNGSAFVAVSNDSAGENLAVFDTASGSHTANTRFTNTNNGDVIMSLDGTQILAGGHLLLDRNLNQLADFNTSAGFARSSSGSTFSNDGSRIYVVSTLATTVTNSGGSSVSYSNPALCVYNASTHQLLGYIPLPANIGANTVQAIAVGNLSAVSRRRKESPPVEQLSSCVVAAFSPPAPSQSTRSGPRSNSSIRPDSSSPLLPSPPPKTSSRSPIPTAQRTLSTRHLMQRLMPFLPRPPVLTAATPVPAVPLSISVGDLRFSNSSTVQSVAAGKSNTIPVNFNTYGSIPNATVQFSCSGLPKGTACSFSPSMPPPVQAPLTSRCPQPEAPAHPSTASGTERKPLPCSWP
jgi:hypothetical protein